MGTKREAWKMKRHRLKALKKRRGHAHLAISISLRNGDISRLDSLILRNEVDYLFARERAKLE